MIKILLLTLLLITQSYTRENPFFPMEGEKDIPYSSNVNRSLPVLKSASVTLPAQARVLESITINFKNLDGSQESKSLDLDNSIDWHLPIFISQSYPSQKHNKKIKKSTNKFKVVASIKYATFYTSDKTMKIITNDRLIRHFLLVKPHRIVLDFKKDAKLGAYIKSNKNSIFKKIRIGNHSGYYRVVVELDGYYRYHLKSLANGLILQLQ